MDLVRKTFTIVLLVVTGIVISACSSGDSSSSNSSQNTTEILTPTPQTQFLLENQADPAVTVTASGLQYNFLRTSEGAMPSSSSSVVTVDYVGTLIDGTVFDSSYARGVPATFTLSGTIDGFQEGIQLMNVGSQIRLVIPADLAYGDRGVDGLIEPGATLIFEIELLEINSG